MTDESTPNAGAPSEDGPLSQEGHFKQGDESTTDASCAKESAVKGKSGAESESESDQKFSASEQRIEQIEQAIELRKSTNQERMDVASLSEMDSVARQDAENGVPYYWVAIGTSAGGLETLQELFHAIPSDSGAAFIVIQHLSPDFKSMMPDLFKRMTDMEVHSAEEGMQVRANHVYLIPPKKNMMLEDGCLTLFDQTREGGLNFPIDIFFNSLAKDKGHRSVAMVLSGTGTDGSRGISSIKEQGGLVIVQDPEDARFDGMPQAAVASEMADIVLPIGSIAQALTNYMTHPLVASGSLVNDSATYNSQALNTIFKLLQTQTGIDFSVYKKATVARRLERRIGINQLKNLQDYSVFLNANAAERAVLGREILIGVTQFFRDERVWMNVKETVIPKLFKLVPSDEPIRIWVAGCSSGEEAYTLAILFDEAIQKEGVGRVVKIFATDVDPNAVTSAGMGLYESNIRADVPAEYMNRCFITEGSKLRVAPHIRKMVIFATHNLISDPPFSGMHLAVCRNVLIYFQPEAQKRVLGNLHFSLVRSGCLVLGSSESLNEFKRQFQALDESGRVFEKIGAMRILSPSFVDSRVLHSSKHALVPRAADLLQKHRKESEISVVAESLIKRFAPDCIVLNSELEVQHVYGDVSHYTARLRSGQFSSLITDIVRDELTVPVSTALHRVKNEGNDVIYRDIEVPINDTITNLSLIAYVIKDSAGNPLFYVLVLEKQGEVQQYRRESDATTVHYDAQEQTKQRIRDLESELSRHQERLQVTVEELETTNEELQSSNEELLAANEELQSTNEELQSVNEELYTVNSEYQEKIDELIVLNADLDNVIRISPVGMIFLDDILLIRSYSPAATKYTNLLEADVGRPIHHLSLRFNYPELSSDVSRVMSSGESLNNRFVTEDGHHIMVNLEPYFKNGRLITGCLISIIDVTQVVEIQEVIGEVDEHIDTQLHGLLSADLSEMSVLIIDDDPDDRRMLEVMLKKAQTKINCDGVQDAEQALAMLAENVYNVCFLDYSLGSTDALALLEEFQKSGSSVNDMKDTAFILVSGQITPTMEKSAKDLGVVDVISKDDFTPALLERAVRYAAMLRKTQVRLKKMKTSVRE